MSRIDREGFINNLFFLGAFFLLSFTFEAKERRKMHLKKEERKARKRMNNLYALRVYDQSAAVGKPAHLHRLSYFVHAGG